MNYDAVNSGGEDLELDEAYLDELEAQVRLILIRLEIYLCSVPSLTVQADTQFGSVSRACQVLRAWPSHRAKLKASDITLEAWTRKHKHLVASSIWRTIEGNVAASLSACWTD